ncbi:DNA polymerase phi-domain-containing protein [Entophlyctis helioformis]|nr:DNA polymerase phi-domain-containing protein [Entophlyctis helioformis]
MAKTASQQSVQSVQSQSSVQSQQPSTLMLYGRLTSINADERMEAAEQLLSALTTFQGSHESPVSEVDSADALELACAPDVAYGIRRLLRGLPSSNDGARQGFAVALAELLRSVPFVKTSLAIDLLVKLTEINGTRSSKEEKELYFGRMFGLMAICQSGLLRLAHTTIEDVALITSTLVQFANAKSYLSEAACKVVLTALEEVQHSPIAQEATDKIIRLVLANGIQNPEELWFAVEGQRIVPSYGGWQELLDLHRSNKDKLIDVLKNTTHTNPRVHSAWKSVISELTAPSAAVPKRLALGDFWTGLDELMFTSTHERKYLGFQVFQLILPSIDESQVALFITPHFMRCLINNLAGHDNFLHKQAKHTAQLLSKLAVDKPVMALPLVMQLIGKHGNFRFDTITRTKTVETILGSLTAEGIESYIGFLSKAFFDPKTMNVTEEELADASRVESIRRWILEQMSLLVRVGKVKKDESWILTVVEFLVVHGFFRVVKKDAKNKIVQPVVPDLSETLRSFCREKLQSVLGSLSTMSLTAAPTTGAETAAAKTIRGKTGVRLNGDSWAYFVCQLIKTHRASKNLEQIENDEDEEVEQAINDGFAHITAIRATIAKLPKSDSQAIAEHHAFELLFLHVLLSIFTESGESASLVKELDDCYNLMFKPAPVEAPKASKKRKAGGKADAVEQAVEESDEPKPEPVEVLMDILISFLAKPSAVARGLASDVFKVFCGRMTQTSIDLIFDVLAAKGGVQGAGELFETEDDVQGMDVDGEDDDAEGDDGKDSEEDDEDEDEDDDDEDDAADFEADSGPMVVDEELRRKIQEALGDAGGNDDDDDEDEGLDDDQMEAFDDKLAEIFRHRKDIKTVKKDTKQSVLHFKTRVLDFIELFIRTSPTSPMIIGVAKSLLKFAESTSTSPDEKYLNTRMVALLKNGLSHAKKVPVVSKGDAIAFLREVHAFALRAPNKNYASLCSTMSIYAVKLYQQCDPSLPTTEETVKIVLEEEPSKKRRKGDKKKDEVAPAAVSAPAAPETPLFSIADTDAVADVYLGSLVNFVTVKNTHIHPDLFTDLTNRYPKHAASLLVPAVQLTMQSKLKSYPLVQAFNILAEVVKKLPKIETELQTEAGAVFLKSFGTAAANALQSTVDAPTEGPFSFGKDRVKDLIKAISAILRRIKGASKKNAQIATAFDQERLVEVATVIAEHERFKQTASISKMASELVKIMAV